MLRTACSSFLKRLFSSSSKSSIYINRTYTFSTAVCEIHSYKQRELAGIELYAMLASGFSIAVEVYTYSYRMVARLRIPVFDHDT